MNNCHTHNAYPGRRLRAFYAYSAKCAKNTRITPSPHPTRNRRNGREHATRTSHFLSRRSFKRDFYGHSTVWTVGKITETQIFEGKWFFYVCSCDICRLIILLLFNAGSATRGDNSGRRLES